MPLEEKRSLCSNSFVGLTQVEDLSVSYPKPRGVKALNYVIACDDSYGVSLVFALTTPLSVLSHVYFPLALLSILPHLHLLYLLLWPSSGSFHILIVRGLCWTGLLTPCSHVGSSHLTTLTPVWSHLLSVSPSQGCSKWCC